MKERESRTGQVLTERGRTGPLVETGARETGQKRQGQARTGKEERHRTVQFRESANTEGF
eukprot:4242083-Lingulodinium_polyedra.AAC.1